METVAVEREFFVTGGTLPAASASYVERAADRQLLEHLRAGRFCYVLNSRQMGKSSLCVRTMRKLEGLGVRRAFVDLTKIGGKNVTPEQWYAGIGVEIARSLGLRSELLENWNENAHLSPVQRLFGSLREVILEKVAGNVAIFFDEIDATRSLPFSADEFFAAIRECYNRRAQDAAYQRLTFCLLGVAVPSDLINSPTSTPFNIGERVYLRDFTLDEAMGLSAGLSGKGGAVLPRIYYWTNGHPYLTQSLCAAAAEQGITTEAEVDSLVKRDLFDPKARETNINLADVGNRALHAGDLESDPEKFRADLLSAYEKAWRGKPLADDEANRVAALLKLSGMMRSDGNRLFVRNRIYHRVFDCAWVRENMPGQELRRQRRAFWLGVARTGTISAVVLAVIGALAVNNARLARLAEERRKLAEYRLYVSDVNLMQTAYQNGDLVRLDHLLGETASSPYLGFEWRFWYAKLNDGSLKIDLPNSDSGGGVNVAPDGKSFAVVDSRMQRAAIYSLPEVKLLAGPLSLPRSASMCVCAGHWSILDWAKQGSGQLAFRTFGSAGPERSMEASGFVINTTNFSPNTNYIVGTLDSPAAVTKEALCVFDCRTLRPIDTIPVTEAFGWSCPAVSDDARIVAWTGGMDSARQETVVFDRVQRRVIDRFTNETANAYPSMAVSADGRYVAVGYASGRAVVRDVASHRTILAERFPGASSIQVSLSSDGRRIMTSGSNLLAQVWDVPSGKLLLSRPGALSPAMTLDGRWLLVAGDGTRVYPVPSPEPARTDRPIVIIGQSREGLVGNRGPRMMVVDFDHPERRAPKCPVVLDNHPGLWGAPYTRSEYACFSRTEGSLDVFRVTDGKRAFSLRVGSYWESDVSEAANRFVTVDRCSHLYVCDLSGRPIWDRAAPGTNYACRITSDGRTVAIGGMDGSIRLYDGATGRELGTLHGNVGCIYSLAFSGDGRRLAAGDAFRTVMIYDLRGRKPPIIAAAHTGVVARMQFSPDDSRLLSASLDGTERLWDAQTGQELLRFGDGETQALVIMFSAGGDRIYTEDQKFRLHRYDAPAVKGRLDLFSLRQ